MRQVPGMSSINRKHTPSLLFTFHKIYSFCDSTLPLRNHEELLYYLALFLFCDLTGMDIFWYSTVKMLLCSHEVAALSLQATHFLSTWLNRFGE